MKLAKFIGGPWHDRLTALEPKHYTLCEVRAPVLRSPSTTTSDPAAAVEFDEVTYEPVREVRSLDIKTGRINEWVEWEVIAR